MKEVHFVSVSWYVDGQFGRPEGDWLVATETLRGALDYVVRVIPSEFKESLKEHRPGLLLELNETNGAAGHPTSSVNWALSSSRARAKNVTVCTVDIRRAAMVGR